MEKSNYSESLFIEFQMEEEGLGLYLLYIAKDMKVLMR